jgi:hypothetical protein
MKHSVILTTAVCVALASLAAAETIESDHVVVSYVKVDKAYAKSIARIVEIARATAIEKFGFDMPAVIKVSVTAAPAANVRLWTNGRDGIFLTVRSQRDLRKPEISGIFNIYGMCHEVGHIAMYRLTLGGPPPWMAGDAAEGWAHYLGSQLVDVVYAKEGEDLWPDAYDYSEDGTKRLDAQIAAANDPDVDTNAEVSGVDRAAAAWKKLVDVAGDKGVAPVFLVWGKTRYAAAGSGRNLDKTLTTIARNQHLAAWWHDAANVLMANRTGRQPKNGSGKAKSRG